MYILVGVNLSLIEYLLPFNNGAIVPVQTANKYTQLGHLVVRT